MEETVVTAELIIKLPPVVIYMVVVEVEEDMVEMVAMDQYMGLILINMLLVEEGEDILVLEVLMEVEVDIIAIVEEVLDLAHLLLDMDLVEEVMVDLDKVVLV